MDSSTQDQFTVRFSDSETRTAQLKDKLVEPRRDSSLIASFRAGPATASTTSTLPSISSFQGRATTASPETIVRAWASITKSGMSADMYAKLVRLAGARDGWRGPGSIGLRVSSLNEFLRFWSLVRNDAAEPELALAPDGSIHAEWFKSARQHLDVRFADNSVRYGMFANNSILEGADRRLEAVAKILRSHHAKPLTWRAA